MKLLYQRFLPYRKLSVIISLLSNKLIYSMVYFALFKRNMVLTKTKRHKKSAIKSKKIAIHTAKQGFTLVELMITVAILAILVTVAAPAIQTKLASMEAKRIQSQIKRSLALAKAESYIRKEDVLVCLSTKEGHCQRDGGTMLLVFIDKSNSKNYDAQVDVLINQQSLNLKYSTLSLRVGNRRHYTKFWGDSGTPRGHFGHIKYCPTVAYNKAMYLISFNQSGIVKQKHNENHPTDCDDT